MHHNVYVLTEAREIDCSLSLARYLLRFRTTTQHKKVILYLHGVTFVKCKSKFEGEPAQLHKHFQSKKMLDETFKYASIVFLFFSNFSIC